MKIVYRISEEDYMGARRLFIVNERPLYRKISRRLMPWIGAFDLVVIAVYSVVVPKPHIGFVMVSFCVGFYLLYCGFALQYFRRSYRKDRRFKHDFTAEISDAGIHLITPFSEGHMKWNSFIRFLESDQIFMVFIAEWNFLIFPKRVFDPAEADEFRLLLRSNVVAPR